MPIAVAAGVVLSLVTVGGMFMHGRIDLGVCVSCAIDFLVAVSALRSRRPCDSGGLRFRGQFALPECRSKNATHGEDLDVWLAWMPIS